MKLKNHIYYYSEIFIILSTILLVHGLKPEEICTRLKYRKTNFENKSELLVIETMSFWQSEFEKIYLYGFCHISKDESEAKLIAGPFQTDGSSMDFSYDPIDNIVYKPFEDNLDIEKIDLNNGNKSYAYKVRRSRRRNPYANGWTLSMDFDWMTKNLYMFFRPELKVLNIVEDSATPKTLLDFKINFDSPHIIPSIIRVFPNDNYLVYTASKHALVRLDKNGSDPLVLYNNSEIAIHQVTLDHHEKNVYWVERNLNNVYTEICFVNVNGGEAKKLNFKESPNFSQRVISDNHLEVDEKYVYYMAKLNENDPDYYLLRADKFNGELDNDFGLYEHYNPEKNDYGVRFSITKVFVLSDNLNDVSIERKFLDWYFNLFNQIRKLKKYFN